MYKCAICKANYVKCNDNLKWSLLSVRQRDMTRNDSETTLEREWTGEIKSQHIKINKRHPGYPRYEMNRYYCFCFVIRKVSFNLFLLCSRNCCFIFVLKWK